MNLNLNMRVFNRVAISNFEIILIFRTVFCLYQHLSVILSSCYFSVSVSVSVICYSVIFLTAIAEGGP